MPASRERQCRATTVKGPRCGNVTRNSSGLCYRHEKGKRRSPPAARKSLPPTWEAVAEGLGHAAARAGGAVSSLERMIKRKPKR
jgi:hypothetical protein